MKEEKRKKGEIGKETLMRKLKNNKLDFNDNIDFLVKHYGFNSRPDLYYAISVEEVKVPDFKKFEIEGGKLKKYIVEESAVEVNKPEESKITRKQKKDARLLSRSNILLDGESADNYKYSLAQCCTPVQGEDIFGYLTAGDGLKIHRSNCKNATHLLANFSYRILKAEWANQSSTNFTVELSITGVDSGPGVITAISNEISNKLGINIRSFSIQGYEGYFEGKVSIFVKNKDQLNHVINSIQKLEGITHVSRLILEDEQ